MDYVQIGIGLVSITIALNPYYHNEWLSLVCAFLANGFLFLGFLAGDKLVAVLSWIGSPRSLDMMVPSMLTIGTVLVFALGIAIYNIVQREMDIQAAKAGVSTPSATLLVKWKIVDVRGRGFRTQAARVLRWPRAALIPQFYAVRKPCEVLRIDRL